jgi:hypothetical protein
MTESFDFALEFVALAKAGVHLSGYGLSFEKPQNGIRHHRRTSRSRSAFAMTDTELKLMAAAATIGLSSRPKAG